jgi:alkanesulfonate monooxygenase SsuD/methylene tetrahydromethanopterin reductase-like flavin-dependent oxidoreductase (luciferase family)
LQGGGHERSPKHNGLLTSTGAVMMEEHIGVGVVISSDPHSPEDPAVAAQHAERLGFDLVTVHPDHPSASGVRGAGFTYEMWTIMTWLASCTSQIRVVPSVMSLPYRHPAVLAKMAESLHRLSEDRFILAVGAGGDEQAFRAFGLPQLSSGGKLSLLKESLEIMRSLWRESSVTYDGRYVQLEGARINPRPTRDIPIWIGGYGPQMLDLVGRSADGWLVATRGFSDRSTIMHSISDVRLSLEKAGRDPRAFTYACNIDVYVTDGNPGNPPVRFENAIVGGPSEVTEELRDIANMGFTQLNLWTHGDHRRQREILAEHSVVALRRPPLL